MKVFIDKKYNWESYSDEKVQCFFVGYFLYEDNYYSKEEAVSLIINKLQNDIPSNMFEDFLNAVNGTFAFILKTKDYIVASVDKIKSYPIFYYQSASESCISNSARLIKNEFQLNELDCDSLKEIEMTSYVTGRETLLKNLYQLRAGEFLKFDLQSKELELKRYYLFYDPYVRDDVNEEAFIEELESITLNIIRDIISDSKGAPIWVPLSGGLDSRLILCLLKKEKYDNLYSYSYGPPGNYEASSAEYVAKKIDVPWFFIPSSRKSARNYFNSTDRKRFWEFADGLYTAPNIHWSDSLSYLTKNKILSEDAIFINGQSGDFIAGQHIPNIILEKGINYDVLLKKIMAKHYSLNYNLMNNDSYLSVAKSRISKVLNGFKIDRTLTFQEFAKLYELWEWQERQCKCVVNGQRHYDYYGIKWYLPLWDDRYLRFWDKIPVSHKLNRNLFVKYVNKLNYYSVFKDYSPKSLRWTKQLSFLQYFTFIIKKTFGEETKKKIERPLDYFGYYSNLYGAFSFNHYRRRCMKYKGPLSYFVEAWINENTNGA